MKRLYSIVSYEGMAVRSANLIPSIEGVVKEAELTTGRREVNFIVPLNGLDIKLECRKDTYVFPNAKFRVNSREKVRIYAKNLENESRMGFKTVQGLQILTENDLISFQYKDCENCNEDEVLAFIDEAEAKEINK